MTLSVAWNRVRARLTHELTTLPVLVLEAHSACNCRCVMCDIWKANADRRELTRADLEPHVAAIRALRVNRIVLTGGEPLLHSNLWALCDLLAADEVRVTLLTTGLLLSREADSIARHVDEVIVSIDGSQPVHDAIRRVAHGFDRIAEGIRAVRHRDPSIALGVRTVVQRGNFRDVSNIIAECRALEVDWLSFLAADLTTTAFNRPVPWDEGRREPIGLSSADLPEFAAAIAAAERLHQEALESGFVVGGLTSLWRVHQYYSAHLALAEFPRVRCNAPWVSAVLEADGSVRPCFFQPAYGKATNGELLSVLNSPAARRFRASLDVTRDDTCRRCVCSLNLGLFGRDERSGAKGPPRARSLAGCMGSPPSKR